jgi:hypothetical protein
MNRRACERDRKANAGVEQQIVIRKVADVALEIAGFETRTSEQRLAQAGFIEIAA